MVLVSYDVSTITKQGRKRLRRIAKTCVNYGQRVQNSVFECLVDPTQWESLRERLIDEMNEDEDSLRFYFMGNNWKHKVEHIGAKPTLDLDGLLMI